MLPGLPATPFVVAAPPQPDLAALDLTAQLAHTTLDSGADPPQAALADLTQLAARRGLATAAVMEGL
eukprot:12598796-Alexandrium_andersonii.AAC.1